MNYADLPIFLVMLLSGIGMAFIPWALVRWERLKHERPWLESAVMAFGLIYAVALLLWILASIVSAMNWSAALKAFDNDLGFSGAFDGSPVYLIGPLFIGFMLNGVAAYFKSILDDKRRILAERATAAASTSTPT